MLLFLLAYLGVVLTIVSPCIPPVLPFPALSDDMPRWRLDGAHLPAALGTLRRSCSWTYPDRCGVERRQHWHDFAAAGLCLGCRDDLWNQWRGEPKSLHPDCWGAVEQADGCDVTLTAELLAPEPETKLFSVNPGGYDPVEFGGPHGNILLVAPDAKAATKKALQQIGSWELPHKDNVFEVEKAVDVTELMSRYGYALKLIKAAVEKPFQFTCAYFELERRLA